MAANFNGTRYTKHDIKDPKINANPDFDINRIPGRHGQGLGKDHLVYGQNSGYQAINLAYILGAKTIVLLGFDMMKTGHWFGEHKAKRLNRSSPYHEFIKHFESLEPQRYGLEIINCTRHTALTCFPRVALENVF